MSTGFSECYLIIIQKDTSRIQHIAKEPCKLNSIFLPMKKEILGYSLVGKTVNYTTLNIGYQNFGV